MTQKIKVTAEMEIEDDVAIDGLSMDTSLGLLGTIKSYDIDYEKKKELGPKLTYDQVKEKFFHKNKIISDFDAVSLYPSAMSRMTGFLKGKPKIINDFSPTDKAFSPQFLRLKLPIIFIVISNTVYGWIKAGQKTKFDKRYFSVDFTRTDHAKVASAYGLKTWTVKKPQELKKIILKAIKQKGPCLIDIISQPLQDAKAPVSEWIA